jgi:hypothetical protein
MYNFSVSDEHRDRGQASPAPLNLTLMTSSCTSGSCPTVYESGRGTLVIQGYEVSTASSGMDVPAGERLVEIPIDLLREAARMLS